MQQSAPGTDLANKSDQIRLLNFINPQWENLSCHSINSYRQTTYNTDTHYIHSTQQIIHNTTNKEHHKEAFES